MNHKNRLKVGLVLSGLLFSRLWAADYSYKPFVQTMLGTDMFIEYVALVGVHGMLDGPAKQAIGFNNWSVDADKAGNIYIYDKQLNAVRVIRKRDGRIFTITGNQRSSYGKAIVATGPSSRLRLGTDGSAGIEYQRMVALGNNPLEGDGSLYLSDPNSRVIVRIFRNPAEGNRFWYEVVSGLGSATVADGVDIASCKLSSPFVGVTVDGRLWCSPGEFLNAPAEIYWMEEGKFRAAYDFSLTSGLYTSKKSRVYHVDPLGRFLISGTYGCSEKFVTTVAADGKSFTMDTLPYPTQWTLYSDQKRPDIFFYRCTDDYSVNQYNRSTRTFGTITNSGTFLLKTIPNTHPTGALGWMRGATTIDGRYVGWSNDGPVFAMSFLDSSDLVSTSKTAVSPVAVNNMVCSPNPFSNNLSISITIASASNASFMVYDVQGRLIRSFPPVNLGSGSYLLNWDGRDGMGSEVGRGNYVFCMRTGKETVSRVVALNK